MVTLYSKPACVQCTATERKLTELGISYKKFDVSEDEVAMKWVKDMGYLQAPVVVPSFDKIVKDSKGERVDHWSGYRPDLLDQL